MKDPAQFEPAPALGTVGRSAAAGARDVRAFACAALGERELEIVYWRVDDEVWVDADGRQVNVDASLAGVTEVVTDGQRVAALVHDPALAADRERLDLAARAVALWLDNERLQLALRSRLEEQEALRRVATLVARHHAPEEVFAVVTEEVARHLHADAAMTARYDAPGIATVVADWAAPGFEVLPPGQSFALDPGTALAEVRATRAPARVDSYEGLEGTHSQEVRELGMRAGVGAPILVGGELWGAVAAGSAQAPFRADAEERLGAFAELVAQAITNVDARVKLKQSRARLVEAAISRGESSSATSTMARSSGSSRWRFRCACSRSGSGKRLAAPWRPASRSS